MKIDKTVQATKKNTSTGPRVLVFVVRLATAALFMLVDSRYSLAVTGHYGDHYIPRYALRREACGHSSTRQKADTMHRAVIKLTSFVRMMSAPAGTD